VSLVHTADDQTRAYQDHEDAVLGMLTNRFPRFTDDERRDFYHEAWALALEKQRAGEQFDSLRNYLLVAAGGRALDRIKVQRRFEPLDPTSAILDRAGGAENPSEEMVLLRDDARIARELIDSLEERQKAVFKLRWDVQMPPVEVRQVLGLSVKQYERLAEEGAAVIAQRVTELHDGTWSRRQRSLLAACLAGIATGEQRAEAQRRLATDPHVRALFADVDRVVGKATALMPLPAIGGERAGGFARAADTLTALKGQLADALATGKQHAGGLAARADPTPLAAGRPGAAGAVIASCLAVGGGGAYCATEGLPDAIRSPLGIELAEKKPDTNKKPAPEPKPTPAATPAPPVVSPSTPTPQPEAAQPPASTPAPSQPAQQDTPPPADPAQQNFGIEQPTQSAAPAQAAPTPAPPARGGDGGGEFGFER